MLFSLINKTSNASSRSWRGYAFASALLLAVVVSSAGCKSGYPVSARNTPNESKEARAVKVAQIGEIAMEQTVTVTGTLAAYDQATVSAKVPGRMKSIAVENTVPYSVPRTSITLSALCFASSVSRRTADTAGSGSLSLKRLESPPSPRRGDRRRPLQG